MSTSLVRPIEEHTTAIVDAVDKETGSELHRSKRRRLSDARCSATPAAAGTLARAASVDATDIPSTLAGSTTLLSSQPNTARSLTRHIDVLLENIEVDAESDGDEDDFDKLDMADFDCPPSSDHNRRYSISPKEQRLRKSGSTSHLEQVPDEQTQAALDTVSSPVLAGNADDSGVFLEPSKIDLVAGSFDGEEEAGEIEEADEEEFEGDDVWDNVPDALLHVDDSAVFAQQQSSATLRAADTLASDDFQETAEEAAANQAYLSRFGRAALNDGAQAGVFQFASSKKVDMSEAALQRAKALLDVDKDEQSEVEPVAVAQFPQPGSRSARQQTPGFQSARTVQSGFAVGRGNPAPTFSKEALEKAKAILHSSSPPSSVSDAPALSDLATLVARPDPAALRTSAAHAEPSFAQTARPSQIVAQSAPVSPQVKSTQFHQGFKPAAARHPLARPLESTPSRSTRALYSANSNTPRPAGFKAPRLGATPQQKSMPAVRRLNLGMTPRKRTASPQQSFKSPFRDGRRPENLAPAELVTPVGRKTADLTPGKTASTSKATVEHQPVFDLSVQGERFPLKAFGMYPQQHEAEVYRKMRVTPQVLQISLQNAADVILPCRRGFVAAYQSLQSALAPAECHVSSTWVKKHWTMVVWKFASYIKSRPDMFDIYWRFEAILNQLKYRYEREVNRAERSSVKRILERDSPAALPIVLCVSRVNYTDYDDLGISDSKRASSLEMTDGWYRINASIDGTLQNAVHRGKIVVGSKLLIVGAKLDGPRDGVDPIEAWTACQLLITGNSTTLAPWHAKLGFVGQTFVASIGSLTSDGGLVAQLDVVIERLFPTGYVNMSKNGGSSETWNEAEEHAKAEAWTRARADAQDRLLNKRQTSVRSRYRLVEQLQEALEDAAAALRSGSPETQSSEDSPEDMLQELEHSENRARAIGKFSATQIRGMLESLAQRGDISDAYSRDVESELNRLCPPRDVRNFRVVRIKDAQPLSEGKLARSALLTVWDANELGGDFLKEGKRYLLTNVTPKGSWHRQSPEVTLATRRDSRWLRKE
ncbi:hypothetical protein ACM66B_001471 [Microbotryomycetes sp. NB124-2]